MAYLLKLTVGLKATILQSFAFISLILANKLLLA